MTDVSRALEALSQTLALDAEGRLTLADTPGLAVGPEEAAEWLEGVIYARYYCGWQPDPRATADTAVTGVDAYVRHFDEALADTWYWDPGWTVKSREATYAFVNNAQVMLLVEQLDQLAPADAAVGDPVHLAMRCARPNLMPGFFYAIGRHGPLRHGQTHVRLYLNVDPNYAPSVARAIWDVLAEAGVRAEMKFANDPRRYGRLDTGVVYVEADDAPAAAALLKQLAAAYPEAWRDGTPLFTWPLARGLAAAESPAFVGGQAPESFGQHRSRLVAEGVIRALAAGEPWAPAVAAAFEDAGVSVAHPYAQALPPAYFERL